LNPKYCFIYEYGVVDTTIVESLKNIKYPKIDMIRTDIVIE